MNILVTGGAGYIGSHILVALLKNGFRPVVFDNLSNSSIAALEAVKNITGQRVSLMEGDIRDREMLEKLFSLNSFNAVIHLAGLKSVGDSVISPLKYYENNVFGSIQLFTVMKQFNVKKLIFSSSATVYGEPTSLPLIESMPKGNPTNPYGKSKLMIEEILSDLCFTDSAWSIINLRYFNPVGAHISGLIGEDPKGMPNNLMPFITQVATGKLKKLQVYGDDYDTHDGTGVRDYIHVEDLAFGHIKALTKTIDNIGLWNINLGTGIGYSVLDLVKTFEKVTERKIPYEIVERRPGDIASSYTDPAFANKFLRWKAQKKLEDMCLDSWRWQSMNPNGYPKNTT